MSLTPSTHSLPSNHSPSTSQDLPFHHQPTYITLSRTLTRLSNTLVPLSLSTTNPTPNLTAHQSHTLQNLLSPLPYHRLKTLHTIEHARTLLLQLEQSANNIRIQRVKRDVVKDLAEKRKVLRRLRGVVEELGREAERREKEGNGGVGYEERRRRGDYEEEEDEDGGGETVEELLGLPPLDEDKKGDERNATVNGVQEKTQAGGSAVEDQRPPSSPPERDHNSKPFNSTSTSPTSESPAQNHQQQRNDLFSSTTTTSNLRNRRPNTQSPTTSPQATTTSSSTESHLRADRAQQTSLTTSLLQLATQLKSQSESLSTTLTTTDTSNLQSALAGLDSNVSGLEAASKKMGFLKRMSEGEGWWGRLMLYAWIVGGWVLAVGLVFVGPKVRF